jgi:serine/threonine protein kinase/Tol biopolymer transport system component
MKTERYQQIDQIFQAALAEDPTKRAAFLDDACAGDEVLRREVESLITSDNRGLSFIDDPAFDVAANLFASYEPELAAGDRVDRYEILSLLGSGGMGEVYLAHDEKLDRKIALKLLPSDFTANQEHLRRFQLEARAASALNHPNIITIYEVESVDGRNFIATEFVDGQTLRQLLRESRLTISESLEIAIQICSALSAAHQAGIVHRDIKPENIMVRRDGYVKVLDFGLAKLTESHERRADVNPHMDFNSSSGLVMGTVKYMSPEQAQAQAVDHRTDLFSLGAVLYEMVTGRAAFECENGPELIRSILIDEPPPLKNHLPEAPDALQRIVRKSLSKQTARRYQSAEELIVDLKALQKKETSLLTYTTAKIKRHRVVASLAAVLLVFVTVAVSFAMFRLFKSRRVAFQKIGVNKFTNFGDAWNPAISPDGEYVVYAKGWGTEGPGKFSLWRKAVGSGTEFRLVPPTEIDGWYGGTVFSPDSRSVIYWVRLKNQPAAIYAVPISGGEPQRFSLGSSYQFSFSWDGKRIAYVDNRYSEGKTVLVTANPDGTEARDIITRQAPSYYKTSMKPSWSTDGKLIACVAQNGNEGFPRVMAINVDTQVERPITTQKWTAIRSVVWLPDMSGLLIAAAEETSSIYQIWHISYPDGAARRITNDTVSYWGAEVTADGKTVVAQRVEAPTAFWVMPVETRQLASAHKDGPAPFTVAGARQINTATISSGENDGLAWTPDGRVVYVSEENGNADIWSMNSDGSDRKQLTTDPHRDSAPDVSPDGRYIAFASNRANTENIWIMNADGSNQRRLTTHLIERNPVFSGDSKWVYFVGWQTGKQSIWKINIDGGEPIQVTPDLCNSPAISPDGKWLAYRTFEKIVIVPSEGGSPVKSIDVVGSQHRWMPDGQALTFLCGHCRLSSSVSIWANIWKQPLDGGAPQQLTDFLSNGVIFIYAWSRDGKQLAVATHTIPSDLVLIRDLQ